MSRSRSIALSLTRCTASLPHPISRTYRLLPPPFRSTLRLTLCSANPPPPQPPHHSLLPSVAGQTKPVPHPSFYPTSRMRPTFPLAARHTDSDLRSFQYLYAPRDTGLLLYISFPLILCPATLHPSSGRKTSARYICPPSHTSRTPLGTRRPCLTPPPASVPTFPPVSEPPSTPP